VRSRLGTLSLTARSWYCTTAPCVEKKTATVSCCRLLPLPAAAAKPLLQPKLLLAAGLLGRVARERCAL